MIGRAEPDEPPVSLEPVAGVAAAERPARGLPDVPESAVVGEAVEVEVSVALGSAEPDASAGLVDAVEAGVAVAPGAVVGRGVAAGAGGGVGAGVGTGEGVAVGSGASIYVLNAKSAPVRTDQVGF